MKKLLATLALGTSMAIIAPAAEAKTASATSVESPQIRVQIGRNTRYRDRNRWGRTRVTTTTRIVGYGRNRYRQTIRVTRYPNGRVVRQVISRERVRW
jgi:hypothetical protein